MATVRTDPHATIKKQPHAALAAAEHARLRRRARLLLLGSGRAQLDGLPGGGLNIAHEAVDRHAAGPRADRVALRWLGKQDGPAARHHLRRARASSPTGSPTCSRRSASAQGERVFVLAGRIPELYIAVLGTLKRGAVFCPLFSAFGPEPIRAAADTRRRRACWSRPRALYREKVAAIRDVAAGARARAARRRRRTEPLPGTLDLGHAARRRRPPTTRSRRPIPRTWRCCTSRAARPARRRAPCTCTRRSWPTTRPGRLALDLHPDDVFWCTADPGWVTGTSYGIIAPLTHGVTSIVDEARVRRRALVPASSSEQQVTRLVHGADRGAHADEGRRRGGRASTTSRALRFVASVGEPLNPEAVVWGAGGLRPADPRQLVADRDRRDHDRQLRRRWTSSPGSMGRPLPGIEAAILRRDEHGERRPATTARPCRRRAGRRGRAGAAARLAVDVPRLPATSRSATAKCFAGGWYLTGDLATRDADGYFWFVGRGRRRHQVGRPPDRPVRGRERADGAPGRRRGRRDRQARSGGRRGGEGVRRAAARLRAERRAAPRADRLRPHAARRRGRAARRSSSTSTCPRRAAARSCGGCSEPRELGLPEGDLSTLEGAAR